ncbi:hypothetical protein [Desulfosarcina cetonica]|uniref:hypothetical protein n=1 Tax=Desulfosarcina cetonica TaxID=90730 RepID=UPI001FEE5AA8|nr:hypothetical protein [Desulfosarcina cetonica]
MDFTAKSRLAGQQHDPGILDDQGVRPHLALQPVDHLSCPVHLVRLDQRVDGNKDLHPAGMGQAHQLGQLLKGEVLGFHARRQGFETAINGIGAGGQGGQKRGTVSRRGENGRLMEVGSVHDQAVPLLVLMTAPPVFAGSARE